MVVGIAACLWASAADLPGFNSLFDSSKYHNSSIGVVDGYGIRNVLINLFKQGAIIVFIIALAVAFISVIKLLSSGSGEEDFSGWIKTLAWSVMGLFLISIAYTAIRMFETRVFSTESISGQTVYDAVINIIYPVLNFLRYIAATVFFMVAIFAFYQIVTSSGDEEKFGTGKNTFIGAIIGFIVMMIAEPLVRIAYGGGKCGGNTIFGISTNCTNRSFDVSGTFGIIAKIIVFLNGFIALITLIMIMYAGFLILTGGGDEEK